MRVVAQRPQDEEQGEMPLHSSCENWLQLVEDSDMKEYAGGGRSKFDGGRVASRLAKQTMMAEWIRRCQSSAVAKPRTEHGEVVTRYLAYGPSAQPSNLGQTYPGRGDRTSRERRFAGQCSGQ